MHSIIVFKFPFLRYMCRGEWEDYGRQDKLASVTSVGTRVNCTPVEVTALPDTTSQIWSAHAEGTRNHVVVVVVNFI